MHDDERIFQGIGRFAKASLIALLYFFGFMIFDVSKSKAFLACLILVLMQVMSLGTGRIRQFGIVFFLLSGLYWINILPLQKLSLIASAKIDETIAAIQSSHAMSHD